MHKTGKQTERGRVTFRINEPDGRVRTLHYAQGDVTEWPSDRFQEPDGRPVRLPIGAKVLEVESETGVRLRDGESATWFLGEWVIFNRMPHRRRPNRGASFAEHITTLAPDRVDDILTPDADHASKAKPGSDSAFTPTEADWHIMRALYESPTTLKQVDIEAASGWPRSRIAKRLPILEREGLVNRPHGKTHGYALTMEGKNRIEAQSKRE